jgi:hypothetical protein
MKAFFSLLAVLCISTSSSVHMHRVAFLNIFFSIFNRVYPCFLFYHEKPLKKKKNYLKLALKLYARRVLNLMCITLGRQEPRLPTPVNSTISLVKCATMSS